MWRDPSVQTTGDMRNGGFHARVKIGHSCEQPMTIALLIALAGSLVAMTYIVRRMEQR